MPRHGRVGPRSQGITRGAEGGHPVGHLCTGAAWMKLRRIIGAAPVGIPRGPTSAKGGLPVDHHINSNRRSDSSNEKRHRGPAPPPPPAWRVWLILAGVAVTLLLPSPPKAFQPTNPPLTLTHSPSL